MADEGEMAAVRGYARYLMDQGTNPRVVKVSLINLLVGIGRSDLIPGLVGVIAAEFIRWVDDSERKILSLSAQGKLNQLSRQIGIYKRVTDPNG
jgi:hypothetical protein